MNLIESKYEIIEQSPGLKGIYKQIELAGRNCYLPDTEVLTDSGWKKIQNINDSVDKVLTYNPESNTMDYDYPNMISYDVCEKLISVNHPQIKFIVTSNHRIFQSVPQKREYSFLTANQLLGKEKILHSKQNRFRIPKYFINSKKIDSSELPIIQHSKEIKHGNRKSTIEFVSLPCNEDFMCIAGAYIAEGHSLHGEKYKTGSYCQITQTENTELYNNVITALNNLNIKYSIDYDRRKSYIKWIKFGNQVLVELFDDLFGRKSKNKHLPIWFRQLPCCYLKILLKNMYLGDGSHNKNRNERYLSISKRLLDEVQECFILLGKNGTVFYDPIISQKCYFEETLRDSWVISRKEHISETNEYSGKVYCTSTKTGIICIRYNGKTCWCGNCYKSENKTTEDSCDEFINRMINSKHFAMLESGTIYFKKQFKFIEDYICDVTYHRYVENPYSKVYLDESLDAMYITTNYRVIVENGWYEDLQYLCEPEEQHEPRVTVRFTTSQGIMRELTRHRKFSFAVESTRYCNYNSDKFNKELTFIKPYWFKHDYIKDVSDIEDVLYSKEEYLFVESLIYTEGLYNDLIEGGCKPQEAREVLPLCTKCDVIMTGFVSDWEYFFSLRSSLAKTGKPHPDMVKLVDSLMEEFKQKGLIE